MTMELLPPLDEALEVPGVSVVLAPETAAKVARILEEGTAPATARAYMSDMRYFERWASLTYGAAPWPVPVVVVLQFIADHLDTGPAPEVDALLIAEGVKAAPGPLSLATVERRVATLSKAHVLAKVPSTANPCRSVEVRELLAKCRKRAAAQGKRPRKKRAATRDVLDAMLATCGDDLASRRDAAVLLLAFASGGRRRSEVAALRVEDLQAVEGGYLLSVHRSKTDQEGQGAVYPVVGRAAEAVRRWLDAAALTSGPLFRRLVPLGPGGCRGFRVTSERLAGQAVSVIVKKRAELAGLDPRAYGAHSLRSGFVTQSGRNGVSLAETMDLSGHRSVPVALGYHQAGNVLRNPAAWVAG